MTHPLPRYALSRHRCHRKPRRCFDRSGADSLTTTALELGFQPRAVVPYMFARLLRGAGYTLGQELLLRAQRARLGKLIQLRDDAADVMMFRLSHVAPPSTRSQRRPLDAVLTFPSP